MEQSPAPRHRRDPDTDADVVVVGAGPAGSTAATHLARAGLDVVVLEKSAFPREKVCGDGLTPRGVQQLVDLGIDTRPEAGWRHNAGLRVVAGDHACEVAWPELTSYPPYGVVRPRRDFDALLAGHASSAGARLHELTTVTGTVVDDRSGRVAGVSARRGPDREPVTFRAPLVLAADGVGARTALSRGIRRHEDRPLGVALRRYYTSPRHDDDYLELHIELSDGAGADAVPGYGWIFGMGDGTSNVGLGVYSSGRRATAAVDHRAVLRTWLASTPEHWGYREENAVGRLGSAALPMGFHRTPVYRDGLLLVGDAGGMVNPFNGEGIAYAMQSAAIAAEHVVRALARGTDAGRERVLQGYPTAVRAALGSYYQLGNRFADAITHPAVVRAIGRQGVSRPWVMRFLVRLLGGLTDTTDRDATDRAIAALLRVTPALACGS